MTYHELLKRIYVIKLFFFQIIIVSDNFKIMTFGTNRNIFCIYKYLVINKNGQILMKKLTR